MEKFETPELEVEEFRLEDVLTASNPTTEPTKDPGDNGLPLAP